MSHEDRKRLWVDNFQTRLACRITAYLGLSLVVLVNFLFAWKLFWEGAVDLPAQFTEMILQYLPVGLCLLLVGPVMAWDAIRFSHRLVGPLVRFRRTMEDVASGVPVRPIKLREGDHLVELRDDFNRMLEALQVRGVHVLRHDPAQIEPPTLPNGGSIPANTTDGDQ